MPSETRVSIVEARWRALIAAARWKGQPAYSTTGSGEHQLHPRQPVGTPGTMVSTSTTTVRGAATSSRRRSPRAYAASSATGSASARSVGSAAV